MSRGPTSASAARDEILERLRAGEVPLDPVNRVPEVGNRLDVHRRYDRPLGGEPFGDRPADAVGGTRDERRAFFEQAHPASVEGPRLLRLAAASTWQPPVWCEPGMDAPDLQLGFGATDEDHGCRADRAPPRRGRCVTCGRDAGCVPRARPHR